MTAPVFFRLVTLAEAKRNIRVLDNQDDTHIEELVIEASQQIMDLVKGSLATDGWTDSNGVPLVYTNGDPQRVGAIGELDSAGDFVFTTDSNGVPIDQGISIIPGPVQRATKALIAYWDDGADGGERGIPESVMNILARFIDPPVA